MTKADIVKLQSVVFSHIWSVLELFLFHVIINSSSF
jgi:hypothetical protein